MRERERGRGRWAALAVVLIAAGCGDRPTGSSEETAGVNDETASGTTSESSASGTSGASTGPVDPTTSSSGSSSDDGSLDEGPWCGMEGDDSIAHCPPDGGGVAFECDPVAQDCPLGEKCVPWANDGGAAWNASRCEPEPPMPDPVGAPCTVEGSAVSGIDSCELAALCWNVDPLTLEGECVAMCGGTKESFFCDDPATACLAANDGALHLCLPTCDPLLQTCEGGQVCVNELGEEGWVCVPSSGEPSADGGPCEYLNVCVAGSVCASAEVVPGCEGSIGCCTPLCDVAASACTLPGTECVPWYEPGAIPPGLEAVGLCSAVTEPPADGWSRIDLVRANL